MSSKRFRTDTSLQGDELESYGKSCCSGGRPFRQRGTTQGGPGSSTTERKVVRQPEPTPARIGVSGRVVRDLRCRLTVHGVLGSEDLVVPDPVSVEDQTRRIRERR